MTTPSNNKFYQWGYHDPQKDPILPLSSEQREIFQRVINTSDGEFLISESLVPSGEGLNTNDDFYSTALDLSRAHVSSPALLSEDQAGIVERGAYYWSSGNFAVWPNPSSEDPCDQNRYSVAWWDVSGIYFSPSISFSESTCGDKSNFYYAYPTTGSDASVVLFDDLDLDAYYNNQEVVHNTDKKYLLWLGSQKNIYQFSIFHYGSKKVKIVDVPLYYNEYLKKYVYTKQPRDYYYGHFSSASHEIIDRGFEDFQIFYTYIHYIPKLKNQNQLTHDKAITVERNKDGKLENLNEIPFVSNPKSVYLYSVYGNDERFIPVLRAPTPPFPPSERGNEETEDLEYNTDEELQKKFDEASGLLGL